MSTPLAPEPGRLVVALPDGWTAVFIAPDPLHPAIAVALVLDGTLREFLHDPEDVRAYAAHLAPQSEARRG